MIDSDVLAFWPVCLVILYALVSYALAWNVQQQDQLWCGPDRLANGDSLVNQVPRVVVSRGFYWRSLVLGGPCLMALLAVIAPNWSQWQAVQGVLFCEPVWLLGIRCEVLPRNFLPNPATTVWLLGVTGGFFLVSRWRAVRLGLATPTVFIFLVLAACCLVTDWAFQLPLRHLAGVVSSLYNLMLVATLMIGLGVLCSRQVDILRWCLVAFFLPPAWAAGLGLAVSASGMVFGAMGMFVFFVFFVLAGMPLLLAGWVWTFRPEDDQLHSARMTGV